MRRSKSKKFALIAAVIFVVSALFGMTGCKDKEAAGEKPEENPESKTILTLGEEIREWNTASGCGRLLEAIQSTDEEAIGCEYWKVRICSEEEQAKGNMFETDYFTFGEPKDDKYSRYKLTIKENVTLPKNLYLGWLCCFDEIIDGKYSAASTEYYIPEGTFEGRTEIETVSMPQRIGTFAKRMFANCTSLKKVYLRVWETWLYPHELWPGVPAPGVRGYYYHISAQMFLNCISLQEVSFTGETYDATGGIAVYKEGFMNCISLKKITFPGFLEFFKNHSYGKMTVITINGDNAFKNCVNFRPADKNQTIRVNEYADGEEPEF